ncbi:MAG: TIGR01777 family oxidoreductase [Terriglobales bacterium]|jgi:uncharacterized protein
MNVLISGASGLVGTALIPALVSRGDRVIRLVRHPVEAGAPEIEWRPGSRLDPEVLEGFDAVIHLAGENIFGRWTEAKKRAIIESRVGGAQTLSDAIAGCQRAPRVFLSASAIGYYGSRSDESLDEESSSGEGFLAEVAREWEDATASARRAGVRVLNLRFGVVLSKSGGALAKMLTPFRLGLGGRLGSGQQFFSWISIDDTIAAILSALDNERVRGPVNLTAPAPVTNAEFAKILARVLHRPAIFPLPLFIPTLVFGKQMTQETLAASQRVFPAKLAAAGYNFRHPELEGALRDLLA